MGGAVGSGAGGEDNVTRSTESLGRGATRSLAMQAFGQTLRKSIVGGGGGGDENATTTNNISASQESIGRGNRRSLAAQALGQTIRSALGGGAGGGAVSASQESIGRGNRRSLAAQALGQTIRNAITGGGVNNSNGNADDIASSRTSLRSRHNNTRAPTIKSAMAPSGATLSTDALPNTIAGSGSVDMRSFQVSDRDGNINNNDNNNNTNDNTNNNETINNSNTNNNNSSQISESTGMIHTHPLQLYDADGISARIGGSTDMRSMDVRSLQPYDTDGLSVQVRGSADIRSITSDIRSFQPITPVASFEMSDDQRVPREPIPVPADLLDRLIQTKQVLLGSDIQTINSNVAADVPADAVSVVE